MTPGAQVWGPLKKVLRLHVNMSKQYLITPDEIKVESTRLNKLVRSKRSEYAKEL